MLATGRISTPLHFYRDLSTSPDNLREHLGYGVGQPWTSAWDIVSGWGLWLVGVFIWIAIVTGVSGWIDQKLGAP